MRSAFFIVSRFIREHKLKALLSALAIAFFAAAAESALLYNISYDRSIDDRAVMMYGLDEGVVYNTNLDKTSAFLHRDTEEFTAFCGYEEIALEDNVIPFYSGYISDETARLKNIEMLEGRLPKRAGEAAVESQCLKLLGINAKIGEQFKVTVFENGCKADRVYTLCGVTDNYTAKWQRLDNSKKSLVYPPPAVILSTEENITPAYIGLVCKKSVPFEELMKEYGGEFSRNTRELYLAENAEAKASKYYYTLPLGAVFLLIAVLGTFFIMRYVMSEYDKYLCLLCDIGMTLRKCVGVYLIFTLLLAASVAVLGSLLALAVGAGFVKVISQLFTGQELMFFIDIRVPLFGALAAAAVITAVFIISVTGYIIKTIMRGNEPAKHKRSKVTLASRLVSFKKVWKKARKRAGFSQSVLSFILVFLAVLLTSTGLFLSVVYAENSASPALWDESEDFYIYIPAGYSDPEHYYANLPAGAGVTYDNYLKIASDPDIKVNSANIDLSVIGSFIVYDKEDADLFTAETESRVLNKEWVPTYDAALASVGLPESSVLVIQDISAVNGDTLENVYGIHDEADKLAFEKGEAVIVPENTYESGDKIRVMIVSVNDDNKPSTDPEKFDFHLLDLTVTGKSDRTGGFVISSDFLTQYDKNIHFSDISLSVPEKSDPVILQSVRDKLRSITALSMHIDMDDRIEQRNERMWLNINSASCFAVLTAVLLFFALAAVFIFTKVRVKCTADKYSELKVIGANNDFLTKYESKNTIKGMLAASFSALCVYAFAAVYILRRFFDHLNAPLLFSTGILSGALAAVLLCVSCYHICKREIRNIEMCRS